MLGNCYCHSGTLLCHSVVGGALLHGSYVIPAYAGIQKKGINTTNF
ncbi:hypothetical protein RFEPED_1667 [Rickettsia felis str. Pedreira]|uniref:Uncharacterized protein n=1 Tax=Rickettsia felis str. Pedreira TaxID=1359196 RepID=A0A0F3MU06_RICFI|nr:hypothetical protein RFEPED_1667 [Rickettsia felis str. Pedreira]